MKKIISSTSLLFLLLSANAQTGNVGIGTATPGSKLTVAGSIAGGYNSVSVNTYSIQDNDYYIVWNPASPASTNTFTLPAVTSGKKGRVYKIKNMSAANNLIINTTGSVLIDNTSSVTVPPGSSIEIIANGNTAAGTSCWEIVSMNISTSASSLAAASSGYVSAGGSTCSPDPVVSGSFFPGVAATNQTVTITVQVTVPGSYHISTNTINGIYFSATGIFSSTGIQSVILYAHGTPVASGSFTFNFFYGSSSCKFVIFTGDAIRNVLSLNGCASCASYDAALQNRWVEISGQEYVGLRNSLLGTYGAMNGLLGLNTAGGNPANYTFSMTIGGAAQVPPSHYIVALAIRTSNPPVSMFGIKLKTSLNFNTGYLDFPPGVGAVTPNVYPPPAGNTIYYFVLKAPTFTTSGPTYMAIYAPQANQLSFYNDGSQLSYYAPGDIGNLNQSYPVLQQFQVLSTPNRQW